jgi:glycosyltransferase involved in cell wall biosynthesis
MKPPEISVVIPVHNAQKTLPACIRSLKALDYENVEVILVNDSSTDESSQIMNSSGFRVLQNDRRGPSSARNLGIRAATHELIAFTDADCIVPPNWLSALLAALESSGATSAGGGQRSPDDETAMGRRFQRLLGQIGMVGDYMHGSTQFRRVRHNPSCNALYHKSALLEVEGFRETLFPGEDVDLDRRLERRGHIFVFTPDAPVAHYRPATLGGCLRMMFRYGRAQGQLIRLHGPFRLLHVMPFVLLGLITAACLSEIGAVLAGSLLVLAFLVICIKARAVVRPDLFILLVSSWHIGFFYGLLARQVRQGHS